MCTKKCANCECEATYRDVREGEVWVVLHPEGHAMRAAVICAEGEGGGDRWAVLELEPRRSGDQPWSGLVCLNDFLELLPVGRISVEEQLEIVRLYDERLVLARNQPSLPIIQGGA